MTEFQDKHLYLRRKFGIFVSAFTCSHYFLNNKHFVWFGCLVDTGQCGRKLNLMTVTNFVLCRTKILRSWCDLSKILISKRLDSNKKKKKNNNNNRLVVHIPQYRVIYGMYVSMSMCFVAFCTNFLPCLNF